MESDRLCGDRNGEEITAVGNYVVMIFHTDSSVEEKGFRLFYTFVSVGKCSTYIIFF